ncbi:hypothetical protein ElyMa_005111100 [Elysia marginata]|uniref:Uncharacterized protein n=1 Tax=Elysia marginata TaxID=1093978 RepID=A0AAV4JMB1_9GAST|nr:hypothetical protein ElyMa_005111100 [Elysia marginata]
MSELIARQDSGLAYLSECLPRLPLVPPAMCHDRQQTTDTDTALLAQNISTSSASLPPNPFSLIFRSALHLSGRINFNGRGGAEGREGGMEDPGREGGKGKQRNCTGDKTSFPPLQPEGKTSTLAQSLGWQSSNNTQRLPAHPRPRRPITAKQLLKDRQKVHSEDMDEYWLFFILKGIFALEEMKECYIQA